MKIGIVLFGNGVIMPDGKTVSPAILSQPLTFDLLAIETIVGGCTQLRLVPPGVARCVADSFVSKAKNKTGKVNPALYPNGLQSG